MNKEQQIDALRRERLALLTWFAMHRHGEVTRRVWQLKDNQLEEVHRQLDALTGESKFHR